MRCVVELFGFVPVAELIFKYTYDTRSRVVEKKVPGAALQYIVYDQMNRVVLTQDGNLRSQNKWSFIKYDFLNRPVYTGIYLNATQVTRPTVQALFDAIDYTTQPRFETEQVNATYLGYSNTHGSSLARGALALRDLDLKSYKSMTCVFQSQQ